MGCDYNIEEGLTNSDQGNSENALVVLVDDLCWSQDYDNTTLFL